MITIVLGDDTAASRSEFVRLRKKYEEAGCLAISIDQTNIEDLERGLVDTVGLFTDKKVFFGQNLLSKKSHRDLLATFDSQARDVEIVVWEEVIPEYTARYFFRHAKLVASKSGANIFEFLDLVAPGNARDVIGVLHKLVEITDEHVVLYVLQKRIRELIVVKDGVSPGKLAGWQVNKLRQQAAQWQQDPLISLYDKLFSVEKMAKTSTGYYSPKEAMEILFCYYL